MLFSVLSSLLLAGKINTGKDVQAVLEADVDFVTIGHSAILHHAFPKLAMQLLADSISVFKQFSYCLTLLALLRVFF
jgi:2,4-dienoyl-CoA reductase-like NADH-dependent reductase (Old Yellow Enzyme family)